MGEGMPTGDLSASNLSPRYTVKLLVDAKDTGGVNPGISKVVFFQDGVPIHTNDRYFLIASHELTQRTPGEHTYYATITDKDGNTTNTNDVVVNFTGYLDHALPSLDIRASLETCRRTTKIVADERDSLDNEGVEWVKFYEDGQLIETQSRYFICAHREFTHKTPGKHTYFAEVKYENGPVIKSKSVTVNFMGIEDTLVPTGDISTNLEEAGQTARLSIDWDDEYDNQGVEKVVIFENGREIYTKSDPSTLGVFEKVKPETPGTHKYKAQIHFKEGHTITTNEVAINFSGELMDLMPTGSMSYNPKKNGIYVSGYDKGDNDGIAKIVLFRDGQPIVEKENPSLNSLSTNAIPPKGSMGEHTFYAEITDNGGQTIRTEEVKVNFKDLEERINSGEITLEEVKKTVNQEESYIILVDASGKTVEQLVEEQSPTSFDPLNIVWLWVAMGTTIGIGAAMGAGAAAYGAVKRRLSKE